MRTIKKLLYYRDIRFFLKVFITSLKISLVCLLGKDHLLLALTSPKEFKSTENQNKEKIIRYVNLCLFLRKRLGIKDTCFTQSLLLCHMLRQAGLDARVNFGAKKIERKLIGHCWVNQNLEEAIGYQIIFSYP